MKVRELIEILQCLSEEQKEYPVVMFEDGALPCVCQAIYVGVVNHNEPNQSEYIPVGEVHIAFSTGRPMEWLEFQEVREQYAERFQELSKEKEFVHNRYVNNTILAAKSAPSLACGCEKSSSCECWASAIIEEFMKK